MVLTKKFALECLYQLCIGNIMNFVVYNNKNEPAKLEDVFRCLDQYDEDIVLSFYDRMTYFKFAKILDIQNKVVYTLEF